MRKFASSKGLSVNAVAGSFVVILGINIADKMRAGLRGFAIKRHEFKEDETFWMTGMKTFPSVEPHPAPGEQFSSHIHPFQSFQWSDYSAKPGQKYEYTIVAMYGAPDHLEERQAVSVQVTTEPTEKADHTIFFNRGSVATQEYARRFRNQPPNKAGQGAYDWLSRGLVESIIGFIARARGKKAGLKGAFYEFQDERVLGALGAARRERNVDVRIVFDDIVGKSGPRKKNEAAIAEFKVKALTKPRANGKLMHNKFIVLTENDKAKAVLFGSTNLTENGLYGHANCVHIIEDETLADRYLAYFKKLTTDPETGKESTYKTWTIQQTPAPAKKFTGGMAPVFSPRANLDALKWYGKLAGDAKAGLFMTFAFGMNKVFKEVYERNDGVLKLGLMEKEWNGKGKDAQIAAIRKIQKLPDVVIAIGNRIPTNGFDQWLAELDRINKDVHVQWVHLKFMLVDPLSDNPTVVTGSANFSDSSTSTNDENMVVIKGNQHVADIYLGEYMRLYSHYAWREAVKIFLENNPGKTAEQMKQGFLIEKGDWTRDYFNARDRTGRRLRRLYFAGKKAA